MINRVITKRVIELHKLGYDSDFFINNKRLICLQSNVKFTLNDVYIQVVDQAYDQLSNQFKYIHTVITCNGDKGVMVIDGIFTNQ